VDAAVKSDRYRARELQEKLSRAGALPELARLRRDLVKSFDERAASCLSGGLIRFAFLIEPVNEDVTSTKYAARWSSRLSAQDPRRADFNTCVAVLQVCCREIRAGLQHEELRKIIAMLPAWGMSPHETPIDYEDKTGNSIHRPDNVVVLRASEYVRLLDMRRLLLSKETNPSKKVFDAIMDKVRVKSYLTDRALTGDFKTNREKRWEAHPGSPQFAVRRDCLMVELTLLDQLVGFRGFPDALIKVLVAQGVLSKHPPLSRCPVTLDPMDFDLLAESVANPKHGKSSYQVGHLNPLKAGDSPEFRHAAANISWISEDGNRIQGHLPLQATRDLIRRIAANYESAEIKKP